MTLSKKKKLFTSLLELFRRTDEMSIALDAELGKTRHEDETAIVLTGYSAILQMLLNSLNAEIRVDEGLLEKGQDLMRVYNEEQQRFAPPRIEPLPCPPELDVDEEDGDAPASA